LFNLPFLHIIVYILFVARHGGSSVNQRMTPATNALDEHKKQEKMQQSSYSSVLDPANNQALIKEVIYYTDFKVECRKSIVF
jgi:hypothetical protein